MEREEAKALVDNLFEARVNGDVDAAMKLVTDDFKFRMTGSPQHSALPTESDGAADFRKTLARFMDNFAFKNFKPLTMLVDGNNIALHWRVEAHNSKSGKTETTELMDFWTVRDGKIAMMTETCDTAMAQWMLT